MLERDFQAKVVKELKELLPDALIFKWDSRQGFPDVLILYGSKWAALEFKRSANASHRPNQDYYVDKMNKMSFSAFIYPENKDKVFDDLLKYLFN